METISESRQKARIAHKCDWCDLEIPIGQIYERQFLKDSGSTWIWKNHVSCTLLATKLGLFEDADMVTHEDFIESIYYSHSSITGMLWEQQRGIDFSEIMEAVRKHHGL